MTPETLKALKESIAHWEKNAAAESPDQVSIDTQNPALCQKFLGSNIYTYCRKCPVYRVTGCIHCRYTPLYAARIAYWVWRMWPNDAGRKARWQKAAQAEVDFLKSLLPEDAGK